MSHGGVDEMLDKYTYVVLYEDKDGDFEKLLAYTSDECCCIDLGMDERLREQIIQLYGIERLPALLYRGCPIYTDASIPDELDRIDSDHIKATAAFLEEFVLPKGITVFIKGTIAKPYCKFTKQLVSIFAGLGIAGVKDFDIFTDSNLRHYMKLLNKWPTFPMIYINGGFIGGLDAFKALVEEKSPLLPVAD